ncbi:helix-turn-helix domain-containing protein [Desulforamulus ruminis]|uniref:Helix-turn-helix domain protein n=1 Tax=Desulforamulus ruminis (strain ATCC 23193 / DSM 2154 / NCIMB 8452 / DL) TaxID=696281 RepID=F6DK71_DESRL|nr:helix-turn-helix transcriptional regulator [Desulforamulus ruminis]AEG60385.1 helix-turn-helix domain protein [Desulforamulus ruminis DSM 2154]
MQKRKLTQVGIIIRKRLIEVGKTQVQLAKEIGTSKIYLNHILHGERSGKKYLAKIFSILGIDPDSVKRTA